MKLVDYVMIILYSLCFIELSTYMEEKDNDAGTEIIREFE
jgi:hypothetical protein